jgi:ferric-dicitrate binding protein FerR (iron transport regulator)
MSGDPATMQSMVAKYLALARTAADPKERERFENYAALYGEMAAQIDTVARRTATDWSPALPPMPLETGWRASPPAEPRRRGRIRALAMVLDGMARFALLPIFGRAKLG